MKLSKCLHYGEWRGRTLPATMIHDDESFALQTALKVGTLKSRLCFGLANCRNGCGSWNTDSAGTQAVVLSNGFQWHLMWLVFAVSHACQSTSSYAVSPSVFVWRIERTNHSFSLKFFKIASRLVIQAILSAFFSKSSQYVSFGSGLSPSVFQDCSYWTLWGVDVALANGMINLVIW